MYVCKTSLPVKYIFVITTGSEFETRCFMNFMIDDVVMNIARLWQCTVRRCSTLTVTMVAAR